MSELLEKPVSRREALSALAALTAGAAFGLGVRPERALAAARAGAAEVTRITTWFELPELEPQMRALLALFHRKNPTLAIDMTFKPPGQFAQALKIALVGRQAPDSIMFQTGAQLKQSVLAGDVAPADRFVPASSMTSIAREVLQFGGHLWGIPLYSLSIGIGYHKPIFKKYGLTPPKTWADLTNINEKLLANGVTPWAMPAADMILPFFFYNMACNSILGPSGLKALERGKRKLTDPDLLKAAQLLIDYKRFYELGYRATTYAQGKALFAQGRAAMIVAGSTDFPGYLNVNPKADLGFAGFPSPTGDKQVTASGLEGLFTINKRKSSQVQANAAQWLRFLFTVPAQQLIGATLGTPIRKGVVVKGNSPTAKINRMVLQAQRPDTLNWAAVAALAPMFTAITGAGGVFTGSLTAQAFAQKLQSAIKV